MFQMIEIEVNLMVSQNAVPSRSHLGGTLPYAFTEHGVLMLATLLKSELTIQVSINFNWISSDRWLTTYQMHPPNKHRTDDL